LTARATGFFDVGVVGERRASLPHATLMTIKHRSPAVIVEGRIRMNM